MQINTFMPSMQFSVSPWQYEDEEVVKISKQYMVKFSECEIFVLPKFCWKLLRYFWEFRIADRSRFDHQVYSKRKRSNCQAALLCRSVRPQNVQYRWPVYAWQWSIDSPSCSAHEDRQANKLNVMNPILIDFRWDKVNQKCLSTSWKLDRADRLLTTATS